MPILFVLAGAAAWFALGHRSPGDYVVERFKRLLVPFVFGVLVIVPPQAYLVALPTDKGARQATENRKSVGSSRPSRRIPSRSSARRRISPRPARLRRLCWALAASRS